MESASLSVASGSGRAGRAGRKSRLVVGVVAWLEETRKCEIRKCPGCNNGGGGRSAVGGGAGGDVKVRLLV